MVNRAEIFSVATLCLLTAGGVAFAVSPLRLEGFGPSVKDDSTLNAGLGALAQQIAWQNSPEGDVYQLAPAKLVERGFEEAAPSYVTVVAIDYGVPVRDDVSLNAHEGALSEMMARLNGPDGDAFMVAATASSNGADFDRVAMASIPKGGFVSFNQ